MPIEGVLLDVAETLFSLAGLRPAFASCGLDPALVPHWFALVLRDGFALAAAGDYCEFAELAQAALISLDPARLNARTTLPVLNALHALEPHPDVADGLRQLWVSGVRIMTLTVGSAEASQALFRRVGLSGYVERFLSTDEIGHWKPMPEAYAYGLQQLNLPPAHVALITAHSWDIHGAKRAGLCTAWLSRFETRPSPAFASADVAGPTLPAVVERLLANGRRHAAD